MGFNSGFKGLNKGVCISSLKGEYSCMPNCNVGLAVTV